MFIDNLKNKCFDSCRKQNSIGHRLKVYDVCACASAEKEEAQWTNEEWRGIKWHAPPARSTSFAAFYYYYFNRASLHRRPLQNTTIARSRAHTHTPNRWNKIANTCKGRKKEKKLNAKMLSVAERCTVPRQAMHCIFKRKRERERNQLYISYVHACGICT